MRDPEIKLVETNEIYKLHCILLIIMLAIHTSSTHLPADHALTQAAIKMYFTKQQRTN